MMVVLAVMAAGVHAMSIATCLAEQEHSEECRRRRAFRRAQSAATDGMPVPALLGGIVLAFAVGLSAGRSTAAPGSRRAAAEAARARRPSEPRFRPSRAAAARAGAEPEPSRSTRAPDAPAPPPAACAAAGRAHGPDPALPRRPHRRRPTSSVTPDPMPERDRRASPSRRSPRGAPRHRRSRSPTRSSPREPTRRHRRPRAAPTDRRPSAGARDDAPPAARGQPARRLATRREALRRRTPAPAPSPSPPSAVLRARSAVAGGGRSAVDVRDRLEGGLPQVDVPRDGRPARRRPAQVDRRVALAALDADDDPEPPTPEMIASVKAWSRRSSRRAGSTSGPAPPGTRSGSCGAAAASRAPVAVSADDEPPCRRQGRAKDSTSSATDAVPVRVLRPWEEIMLLRRVVFATTAAVLILAAPAAASTAAAAARARRR